MVVDINPDEDLAAISKRMDSKMRNPDTASLWIPSYRNHDISSPFQRRYY